MSVTKRSSDHIAKRLAAIAPEIKARVAPALIRSAEEVAGKARQLAEASRDTGDLIESIPSDPAGWHDPALCRGWRNRDGA